MSELGLPDRNYITTKVQIDLISIKLKCCRNEDSAKPPEAERFLKTATKFYILKLLIGLVAKRHKITYPSLY